MIEITMVGIDHNSASIEKRELFSFTSLQAEKLLKQWKKDHGKSACLLLSTCNRTELWVTGESTKEDLLKLICSAKELRSAQYEEMFSFRTGNDAINHLLRLTCGLQSMIQGEDQILTQVKEALDIAREANTSDTLIEKLFQTAISAGKKVKTNVKVDYTNPSLAEKSLLKIKEKYGMLENLRCLIIGNGLMAQLAANVMTKEKADVSMTLRKQFHGKIEESSIRVSGCTMIPYDDRLKEIEKYQIVISATRSPHFTVKAEDLSEKEFLDALWIDMAVPRDLEPKIGKISGIQLLDIDEIGLCTIGENTLNYSDNFTNEEAAEKILSEYAKDFDAWYEFRRYVDLIKNISALVKEDINIRTPKNTSPVCGIDYFQSEILDASQKSVEKLLFGLKETLPHDLWKECLVALEHSAKKDTIKT